MSKQAAQDLLTAVESFIDARDKQMTQATKKERFKALRDAAERARDASAR